MSQDTIADDLLRSGYQRWLRLEEAKADISEDLKQLFIELKGNGLDAKALRVSFRRVRDADSAEVAEQEALVNLYVASLTRDTRVRARENIEEFGAGDDDHETEAAPSIDRAARRRHRFSESMEDAVELSAEAVADGLISPEAHAETVRLSSALAAKFGEGPLHDAETGEIIDPESEPASVPAQSSVTTPLADESVSREAVVAALPATNSPETATQSTAALKEVSSGQPKSSARSVNHLVPNDTHKAALDEAHLQAGTQAQPVDTKSARLKTTDEVADDMGLPLDPHPSCRKPKICGRFSHKGLCAICRGEDREAA